MRCAGYPTRRPREANAIGQWSVRFAVCCRARPVRMGVYNTSSRIDSPRASSSRGMINGGNMRSV